MKALFSQSRRGIIAVLCAYALLVSLYIVVVPLYEASDELWHYPMVQYMATHGLRLPPQDLDSLGAWRQEGSQPPLYYMLAALLTMSIDTSDMPAVRRVNPHADIGIVPPDGNVNMMTHSHNIHPLRGTALASYISRLFSAILGGVTVYVTYRTACLLFPDAPHIALAASAFNAFLPMYLFISASVNNDNLSNLLSNALVWVLLSVMSGALRLHWRTYALMGVLVGAGILSKLSIGFLIPLVAAVLAFVSLRARDWRPFVIGGVVSGALTITIAGWWYWHNWQTYGDPTGLNRFLDIVGRRPVSADWGQIWAERDSFLQAFWGFFGGMNVPMPAALYNLLNAVGLYAAVSALVFTALRLVRGTWRGILRVQVLFTWLWIAISLLAYARWTSETIASQGRLIFGALSVIAVWLMWGMVWWLPRRAQARVLAVSMGALGMLAAVTPLIIIRPTYVPPEPLPVTPSIATFSAPEGGKLSIMRTELLTHETTPASFVHLVLDVAVLEPLARDWSLFVHLVDPNGVIISQRDLYPAGGLFATSDLVTGRAWRNPIAVYVPASAYTPLTLDVVVGWYHLPSGERLRHDAGDTLHVGQVTLMPRPNKHNLPNPQTLTFDGQIALLGYTLSTLSPQAGDTVELTLYWQAVRPLDKDYTVFAQLLDPSTATQYASSNAMPAAWTRPTSTWQLGEIVEDTHTLIVAADTPPALYELIIGLYTRDESGRFLRLRVDGSSENAVFLSRLRVHPQQEEENVP